MEGRRRRGSVAVAMAAAGRGGMNDEVRPSEWSAGFWEEDKRRDNIVDRTR